ncbi:MAG: VWA domain-containing protein [Ardenticatenaceae bacterium]|nr:VWA domain-containing protein [Ardenticatenaceae bacterium]
MNWTLLNPLALLLLPALWLVATWLWHGRGVSLATWALRFSIIALLVLALADPQRLYPVPTRPPTILLVDQSASLGDSGAASLRAVANRAAASFGTSLRTILFAQRALVLPPGVSAESTSADLGREGTDLAGALELAAQLLPGGQGRIVVLSDGGDTGGSLTPVADRLAAQEVAVDVWPASGDTPFDVGLTTLDVPPVVRQGETYVVTVVATASTPAQSRLQLWQGSKLLAEQELELKPGSNQFFFTGEVDSTASLGFAPFRVQIVTEGDAQPQNDRLSAATVVAPAPNVLLVGDTDAGLGALQAALTGQGMKVTARTPESLPDDPDRLARFDAVWLLDVNAERLTVAQMSALQALTRDLGKGLVVSGGRESFAVGKYENTPLEAALPVRAEPPPRAQRRGVTLLLIVDHSASMDIREVGTLRDSPTKLEMAKQAAVLAAENLSPDDRIGVLQFDSEVGWVMPFQTVGAGLQREELRQAILAIPGGGGTNIPAALAVGFEALAAQPPGARHAVLLTDGRSTGATLDQYRALTGLAREAGITLSTIAIGDSADQPLLQQLAEWGQGRYAFAAHPEEIPALTIRESEMLRAESVQEGLFRAELVAAHPTLRGFIPNQLPELEGYLATTPRPQAETVLAAPEGDPLLAAWQYGLGRSVVWTADVGGPWTRDWSKWSEAGRFWANLVSYTFPDPLVGPLALRVSLDGDVATLEADALEANGTPINQAILPASIALVGEASQEPGRAIALLQVAPGRYRQMVRLPKAGVYRLSASLDHEGQPLEAEAAIVQPYPAEFRPNVDGTERLVTLAARTGGQVLASPEAALPAAEEQAPPPLRLAPILIAAALALWPLEIALRRGWLARLRRALRRWTLRPR